MTDNIKQHRFVDVIRTASLPSGADCDSTRRDLHHRRRGFTLMETLVASSILITLGIGFMTLYVNIVATSTRVSANAFTAMDAAKAVDRISITLREARRFEFMDNGTTGPIAYQSPTNVGNNPNYSATLGGSAGDGTIVTGLHIVHPAKLPNISLNVPSGSTFTPTPMSGAQSVVDYRTDGGFVDVYRSDRSGRPAPTNGQCLWIRGTLNGATIATDSMAASGIDGRPFVDDIAAWPGAVQFLQGQTNEVRIKIVTGKYYRAGKQVTSDSGIGAVTSLTANNVYLRNHDPNGVRANSAHGKTQYTGN
ncbi:MAG: type II secretion system protein [Akkermansiaceae bacterium]|nr:type II secretion system protein [Armatimonadota bacterium]